MRDSRTEEDRAPPERTRSALKLRWTAAFLALVAITVLVGWMSRNILEIARIEARATARCAAHRARIEEAAREVFEVANTRDPALRAERRARIEPVLAGIEAEELLETPRSQLTQAAGEAARVFVGHGRAMLARPASEVPTGSEFAALSADVDAATDAIDAVTREMRGNAQQRIDDGLTALIGMLAASGGILLLMGAFIYIPTTRLLARAERELRESNDSLRRHVAELSITTNDLRRAHARSEAIFNAAADGILTIDLRGVVDSMNPAAERLFGWKAGEVIGRNVTMLMPPAYVSAHEQALAAYLRTGETKVIGTGRELMGLRKDGSSFPIYVSVGEMAIGDERRLIGIIRDVGDRKRVEESLARQAEELARSNTELEQFAYVASHDLQEPLRAIGSFSSLLARRYKGRLDEQADEFIGYVESGARRMHELIRDLLEYSRVSRRREPFTRVSSADALEAALANLQATIAEARPEIERGPLPEVFGDGLQLTQLFQNLVGNALKFRGAGAPRVRVGAVREGGAWRFSVRDNGIGIDPRFAERIFVIFQRLHTRDRYTGNGIGLAICKKIVERHGGRIWVDSKPGEGCDFQFTLPAQGAVA